VEVCAPEAQFTRRSHPQSRITNAGYSYDPGGDVLDDGVHTYTRNDEGRLATATAPSGGTSTTSFIYNALGERVQLLAPTYTYNYPFDAFGKEIGIHNSSTGWGHYTVEMAGRRIFLSVSATRSRTSTRRTSACSPPTRAAGSAPTQRPAAAGTHKIITGTLTFAPTPPMG